MARSRTYAFELGETIAGSPYVIRKFLGAGGHGAVFFAEDVSLRLPVVVKVLHPEYAETSAADRLRKEGRALAALGRLSSSFASVLRSDDALIRIPRAGGIARSEVRVPYFVMDFINGPRLRDLVSTAKQNKVPIDVAIALSIGVDIAMALSHAHAAGMVHRDIKPDNIMFHLRERDVPALRIIDFGVIRWSDGTKNDGDHKFQGTLKYAAPEQLEETPVSGATDLYALGVVLFELLTGGLPFDGDDAAIARGHLRTTPPSVLEFRPDAPRALAEIVAALLAKKPHERTAWLGTRDGTRGAATINVAQVLAQTLHDLRLDVQSGNSLSTSLAALLKDVSWRGRADTTHPSGAGASARRRFAGDTPVNSHEATVPPVDSLLSGLDSQSFELDRMDRLAPPARPPAGDATDPSMGPPVTAPMEGRPPIVVSAVDINKTEEQPFFPHTLPLGMPAFRDEPGARERNDSHVERSPRVAGAEAARVSAPRELPSVDTPPPRTLYSTSDVLDAIDEAIDEIWEDDTRWHEPLSERDVAGAARSHERRPLDPFFVSDSPTVTSEASAVGSDAAGAARRRRARNVSLGITAAAAAFAVVALALGGRSWVGAPTSAMSTAPSPLSASPPAMPPPATTNASPPQATKASALAVPSVSASVTASATALAAPRTLPPAPRGFVRSTAAPLKPASAIPSPPPNDVGEFKTRVER